MLHKQRYHRLKPDVGRLVFLTFFLVFIGILGSSTYVCAFSWDIQPPIPTYDPPRWKKVKTLWNKHYNEGNDLNDLIHTLKSLNEDYPAKIEPIILLAKAHYLHARYKKMIAKNTLKKRNNMLFKPAKWTRKTYMPSPRLLKRYAIVATVSISSANTEHLSNPIHQLKELAKPCRT